MRRSAECAHRARLFRRAATSISTLTVNAARGVRRSLVRYLVTPVSSLATTGRQATIVAINLILALISLAKSEEDVGRAGITVMRVISWPMAEEQRKAYRESCAADFDDTPLSQRREFVIDLIRSMPAGIIASWQASLRSRINGLYPAVAPIDASSEFAQPGTISMIGRPVARYMRSSFQRRPGGVEIAFLADGYVAMRNAGEDGGHVLVFCTRHWTELLHEYKDAS